MALADDGIQVLLPSLMQFFALVPRILESPHSISIEQIFALENYRLSILYFRIFCLLVHLARVVTQSLV